MDEDKKIKYIKQISNDSRFYVRIRLEDENKIDSKVKKSEVYYMGFKIFSVGSRDLITGFDDKFFKFNSKNIYNAEKNDNQNQLIQDLRKSREMFFNKFQLKSITFDFGKKITKEEIENALKEVNECIKNNITINDIAKKIYIKKQPFTIEDEYELSKILFKNYKSGNSNVFSKVTFCFDKERKQIKDFNDELVEKIDFLISRYESNTKLEYEKKYQHQFLVKINQIRDISNLIPFEEEYYIVDNDDGDYGRIDCIFYSLTKDKRQIENIYLIEIKVNDGVLGGTNGLHKHLFDIERIYKKKIDKEFFETIVKRINNRRRKLNKEEYFEYPKEIKNRYFLIIVGKSIGYHFSLEDKIKDLNDSGSSLYKTVNLPKANALKPLNELVSDLPNDIIVKLYEDVNPWKHDGTISDFNPKFKDKTDLIKKHE